MSKVIVNVNGVKRTLIKVSEISQGTYFTATVIYCDCHAFFRAYQRAVCLKTGNTWDMNVEFTNYIECDADVALTTVR